MSKVKILETERLILRQLTPDDAEFILRLVNEPSWLRFIGDKGVRSLDDARAYIINGPMDMYSRLGFGMYAVESKTDGSPMGICGLIKRDSLEDVDIGFAFLPQYWGSGYAFEAAAATLQYGRNQFGLQRILAIVTPQNERSIKLLEKLGMKFDRLMKTSEDGAEVRVFSLADSTV